MWCQSFWIWEKMDIFFYLFGNSLCVLIHMFMHSVLKSFRCNFRNKQCNWVTNHKSMKPDFATLRIKEKTILQIKNLLTFFLFPDESLWLEVSMTGYQWVFWCGRRALQLRGCLGHLALGLGLHCWTSFPSTPAGCLMTGRCYLLLRWWLPILYTWLTPNMVFQGSV